MASRWATHAVALPMAALLAVLPCSPTATSEAAKASFITPASEAAVQKALSWLAKNQRPDGSWHTRNYYNNGAVTALACLAFLASGSTPGRGKYGRTITRALGYLLSLARADGLIASQQSGNGTMYEHGFATHCLAELYGMTGRRDLRPKLERAVRLIQAAQNPEGGWRYQPVPRDADMSVTVCEMVALRAARNAAIPVPKASIEKAVAYMKSCTSPEGGFAYQGHGPATPACTGGGALAMMLAGRSSDPAVRSALEYLRRQIAARGFAPGSAGGHFFYAMYYCTQAMYQAGGAYWRAWFPPLRDRLVSAQRPDGSWEDLNVGVDYGTAMGALILEVPKGYLPIFQR